VEQRLSRLFNRWCPAP